MNRTKVLSEKMYNIEYDVVSLEYMLNNIDINSIEEQGVEVGYIINVVLNNLTHIKAEVISAAKLLEP